MPDPRPDEEPTNEGHPERDEGFVSKTPLDDDEIDLAAPVGTEEFDRAQEEVMIDGAAEAATDTEGIAADPSALDRDRERQEGRDGGG